MNLLRLVESRSRKQHARTLCFPQPLGLNHLLAKLSYPVARVSSHPGAMALGQQATREELTRRCRAECYDTGDYHLTLASLLIEQDSHWRLLGSVYGLLSDRLHPPVASATTARRVLLPLRDMITLAMMD